MTTITLIQNLIAASKNKEYLGDYALLKAALSKPKENIALQAVTRELVRRNHRGLALENLSRLHKESLGYNYYRFITDNKISLVKYSDKYLDLLAQYPLSARYAQVHDIYHVLLDFAYYSCWRTWCLFFCKS